ncbi:hypothetical protein V7114_06775 [Neobacillus niacini]|uniref:hypothetical protein n=1 Tax=Neobacillus niacini TaxID=86668 RepID=UPI002FFF3F22
MSKTHVIDGKKYVEVSREAEVGENIVVVSAQCTGSFGGYKNGDVFTVEEVKRNTVIVAPYNCLFHYEYRVLQPVEETPSVTDLLANLARRVASLEQQLSATQSNVEKLAEELASVKYIGECNTEDIIDLDQHNRTKEVEKFLDSVADKVAQKLVGGERQ